MILVDFSSTMHRMVAVATKEIQISDDNKYVTEDFIFFALFLILQELNSIQLEHKNKFGNLILCLDNASGGYWRKDIYSMYKHGRKNYRDESPIKWDEVYVYMNELLEIIDNYLPWQIVSVKRAEADDVMLVLSRHFNKSEPILIHSPDKDMIQAQKNTDNVFQYSSLTKKWIVPENKNDNMSEWLLEHVCLGDSADGIPRIIDETEFSENFKKYLKENNVIIDNKIVENPMEFDKLEENIKEQLINNYNIYKTNKKGEDTELDIFIKERFGLSTLKKRIEKIGSLEDFLDSHPLYRKNYDRNHILIMEEGIPSEIWNNIILAYKESKNEINSSKFEEYLDKNNLGSLKMTINFEYNRPLTVEDFGW